MPRSRSLTRAHLAAFRPTRRFVGSFVSIALDPKLPGAVACVVSKKVSKSAAVRNRIKRRCREIVRAEWPQGSPALMLQARREASDASFAQLQTDIKALLSKALAHGTIART